MKPKKTSYFMCRQMILMKCPAFISLEIAKDNPDWHFKGDVKAFSYQFFEKL